MRKTRDKSKRAWPFLASALFCGEILEEKDGALSLIRIVDTINMAPAQDVPPQSFAMMKALLAFKSGEAKGEYDLRIDIVYPSGKRKKSPAGNAIIFLGEDKGLNIQTSVPAPVDEPGLYWFEVRLDGRLYTKMPLRIVHLSPTNEEEPAEPPDPDGKSKNS